MRLPTVIKDDIPDVNLTPLLIYCPIIPNILQYVMDSYLPVTENTSAVSCFLLASLIPLETVLLAYFLRVLGIDPTQIIILNPLQLVCYYNCLVLLIASWCIHQL